MAKMSFITAALLLLSGTGLAGCALLPTVEEPLSPPLVKPAQEAYTTSKVTKGTIAKEFRGTAIFEPIQSEDVQFTAQGGRVQKIYFKEGATVKKGDLLVQLTVDGLDLQVKEQKLALEKAKYALTQAADKLSLEIATLTVDIEQTKYNRLLEILNNKQLRAPMDGLIIFVEDLKPGDNVDAYQTLVRIADPTQLRLRLNADNASDLKDIEVGMTANVKVGSTNVEGKVVQTPSSAPATKNEALADKYSRSLYINVPETAAAVQIGMSADVTIPLEKHENTLIIPRSGLRNYNFRSFVQVLEGKGVLREVDVEVGIKSSTEIEIIKGLNEGQDVVLQN